MKKMLPRLSIRQISDEFTLIGALADMFGDAFDWRPKGKYVEFAMDGMSLVTIDGDTFIRFSQRVVEIPRSKWMGPLESWNGFRRTGHWCFESDLEDAFERFY